MKLLYILNVANKVNNFSKASMMAAKQTGLEFYIAGNWKYKSDEERKADEVKYGIKIYQVDFYRNPLNLKNIKAYHQIVEIIKNEKIDIIHCNTPIGGVVGRIAGLKCKVKKVIYQAHGFHFYSGDPKINWFIYYPMERWLAHYTDVLITINHEDYTLAQKLRLKNYGRVCYVPGVGIDTKDFTNVITDSKEIKGSIGLTEDDIVCISMGDLIPRKNYETSIKAIALCNNTNIHYLICGNGPELEKLKNLSKKLGIEKQVHFLGFRIDIKELAKVSDIFLFTTLQEGMPRSMMEAMASGLPCIASKIRGNVDLLVEGKGGYLVPAKDAELVAECLRELINNKSLRKYMGNENLSRIKEFEVSIVKKRIKEIYEEVIGESVK